MFRPAILLCLLAFPAVAADRGFSTYERDTTRATFRIANIDAPEMKGQCDCIWVFYSAVIASPCEAIPIQRA